MRQKVRSAEHGQSIVKSGSQDGDDVPRCRPEEKTARSAMTDASWGSSMRGFFSERSGRRAETGEARHHRRIASGAMMPPGTRGTYCSQAAPERGPPWRLRGSERRAESLAGVPEHTCVASQQTSGTHSDRRTTVISRRSNSKAGVSSSIDK